MNELTPENLVERVKEALTTAEGAYIAACVWLKALEGKFDPTQGRFSDYCKDVFSLSAPKVSKMLWVGNFVSENQISDEQLQGATMTSLYESGNLHKGAAPDLILAEAKSNSVGDIRSKKRQTDPCTTHEFFCKNCSISLDEASRSTKEGV